MHFRVGSLVFAGAIALSLAALAACSHDDECAADSCDSCACIEVPDAGGSNAFGGGPNGGGGSAGTGGSAGAGGTTVAIAGTGAGG